MNKCPHCNCEFNPYMTGEEFRKKFKRGDILTGYSTGKRVRITGIGDTRFLYINPDEENQPYKVRERIASMHGRHWRLVEEDQGGERG